MSLRAELAHATAAAAPHPSASASATEACMVGHKRKRDAAPCGETTTPAGVAGVAASLTPPASKPAATGADVAAAVPATGPTAPTGTAGGVGATGNKKLNPSQIPPKPHGMGTGAGAGTGLRAGTGSPATTPRTPERPFCFRLSLTSAKSARKFLAGIAKAVPELCFHLVSTPNAEFEGFRVEAHDAALTMAVRSQYKCEVVAGTAPDGTPLTLEALNAVSFCVASQTFVLALDAASAENDAVMHITQYYDRPATVATGASVAPATPTTQLVFETFTDLGARRRFTCDTLETSSLQSLDRLRVTAEFHQEISLDLLQRVGALAKKAQAPFIRFRLDQCGDPADADLLHSRLVIDFAGNIQGEWEFKHTMRRVRKGGGTGPAAAAAAAAAAAEGAEGAGALASRDGGGVAGIVDVVDWTTVPDVSSATYDALQWTRRCDNVYDAGMVSTFLRSMEGEWAMVHLTDKQPLVLEIATADKATQHLILIAPRTDEETVT